MDIPVSPYFNPLKNFYKQFGEIQLASPLQEAV
jgi:hypothetical protein